MTEPGPQPADAPDPPASAAELMGLLAAARSQAAAAERRRLARDVHDGVTQDLAALGYAVDDVIAEAQRGADVLPALRSVRGEVSVMLRELRQTLAGLRSGGDGLAAELSASARRLADRHGWQLHLNVRESGPGLPAGAAAEILHIGQEALINVGKHARARQVWVTCHVDPPAAVVRVDDDGIGMGQGSRTRDSYGFVTMMERAQLLGASLSVRERPPTGTSVEVRFGGSGGRRAAASTG